MKKLGISLIVLFCAWSAFGAGVLTPVDSQHAPIQIKSHQVNVTINNGFAMTEVIQVFFNPNNTDLEALYSFPLPKSASLSEMSYLVGEEEIHGEVLAKDKAREAYEKERESNNNAALCEKDEFYAFEFYVTPVRAQEETRIRFLYYQPLKIEAGVGRYLYPLQEGGTDEKAKSFWTNNPRVEEFFTINVELKSAWPVTQVRAPGYESQAATQQLGEGHYHLRIENQSVDLNKDFVFYYRLADNLPGRVEVLTYKEDQQKPGAFMMVVTPGMDLKKLDRGADYTFVLDVSGSMSSKLRTLANGVAKALGEMTGNDRFRIITFSDRASDLTRGWVEATKANVDLYVRTVSQLNTKGGTNLFAGISLALEDLDDDRATSIVLVTDAVTNRGVVDPAAFHKLMKKYDVRVFGFVMGNSGNWPLMRVICEASGGFSAGVSNDDDIIGQIMLAKSKVVYECLHDSELKIRGINAYEVTGDQKGKVYQGQQLVLFGRYQNGGEAKVSLKGRMTGEDKTYSCTIDFPDMDTEYPELERLWALSRVEQLEYLADIGDLDSKESQSAIQGLGLNYQLVTDETSMVALSDAAFIEHGIERNNQARIKKERQARSNRSAVKKPRKEKEKPMFKGKSHSIGGGALDAKSLSVVIVLLILAAAIFLNPKKQGNQ